MARPVNDQASKHGRRYPWKEWFSLIERKGSLLLMQGKDYHGRTDTFIQHMRAVARRPEHDMRLNVDIAEDGRSVTVGFHPRGVDS